MAPLAGQALHSGAGGTGHVYTHLSNTCQFPQHQAVIGRLTRTEVKHLSPFLLLPRFPSSANLPRPLQNQEITAMGQTGYDPQLKHRWRVEMYRDNEVHLPNTEEKLLQIRRSVSQTVIGDRGGNLTLKRLINICRGYLFNRQSYMLPPVLQSSLIGELRLFLTIIDNMEYTLHGQKYCDCYSCMCLKGIKSTFQHLLQWSQTQFLEGNNSAEFISNQLQITPA